MRFTILALLASALIFTACKQETKLQTSDMGTRYTLFKTGSGEQVATGEYVYFHAAMRTEGDSVLFSTRDGVGEMPVIQAAPFEEADEQGPQVGPVEDVLRYMRLGDSAVIRVNIEQFPNKPPGLEQDTVVFYDVVVMEIVNEETFEERRAEKDAEMEAMREVVRAREEDRKQFAEQVVDDYRAGKLDNVQETESGLKYIIHEEGTGARAQVGDGVTVQYIGKLVTDGKIFDQSFARGEGIPFQLGSGQVIPGWDEGIALLKEGTQATLFIPSELAYGANGTPDGSIPADSELAFYIELEKVN